MRKFFSLSFLAKFCLILSSTVKHSYGDLGLLTSYHNFFTKPSQETYDVLRTYAIGYYDQSPIDCLKFLKRYHGSVFRGSILVGINYDCVHRSQDDYSRIPLRVCFVNSFR